MNIQEKLAKIQQSLVIKKGQTNSFGGYQYRSCEDILEAVKPLLGDLILLVSDDMVNIGDRYYIKAVATLFGSETSQIGTTAYAREALTKKGMDEAQITGAASSYARKYALNGLFAIDDTKDADTMDNRYKAAQEVKKGNNELTPESTDWNKAVLYYKNNGHLDGVRNKFFISKENEEKIIKQESGCYTGMQHGTYHYLLESNKSIEFADYCKNLTDDESKALFNSFETDKTKNKEKVRKLEQEGLDHILIIKEMIDGTTPDAHADIYAKEEVTEKEIEIIENWQRG